MSADTPGADVHASAAAYVADALEPAERDAFERHLATCAACRDEVAELAGTAVRLSDLTATPPPPDVLDRTLAQIRTIRPLPPLAPEASEPEQAARPTPAEAAGPVDPATPATHASRVDDLAARRQRRSTRVARWVAVAAVVVALAAAGGYVHVRQDLHRSQAQIQATRQLLAAPDLRTAHAKVRGGGTALVLASASQGEMLVTARGLPVLDADKTYQLWLIGTSGKPRSAGTFDTRSGTVHTELHADLGRATTLAISIEPAGGSPQPTTTPIFAQKLTS